MNTKSINKVVTRPPRLAGEVNPSNAQTIVQTVIASICKPDPKAEILTVIKKKSYNMDIPESTDRSIGEKLGGLNTSP
jgi:hypothetical protein